MKKITIPIIIIIIIIIGLWIFAIYLPCQSNIYGSMRLINKCSCPLEFTFQYFKGCEKMNNPFPEYDTNTNATACQRFFDGCNTCTRDYDGQVICSERECTPEEREPYRCLDDDNDTKTNTNRINANIDINGNTNTANTNQLPNMVSLASGDVDTTCTFNADCLLVNKQAKINECCPAPYCQDYAKDYYTAVQKNSFDDLAASIDPCSSLIECPQYIDAYCPNPKRNYEARCVSGYCQKTEIDLTTQAGIVEYIETRDPTHALGDCKTLISAEQRDDNVTINCVSKNTGTFEVTIDIFGTIKGNPKYTVTTSNEISTEEDCLQANGEWGIFSHDVQEYRCNLPTTDGGQECSNGDNCEVGVCFADLTDDEVTQFYNNEEIEKTGTCPEWQLYSSGYTVENGIVNGELIVD
ncbi:hypothetical protein KKC06_06270 [Patescibacteria group bacterium]|nr:hypothetical protein [Patescibacteria group bacterium]